MKKIYISILAITASLTSAMAQVPTCSLNPAFIAGLKVGIFPDSATNFISGNVGTPYVQNLTVKVPLDTVSSGITFCFNRFEVTNPTGATNYNLPPGLMLGSSTSAIYNGTVNASPAFKFPRNANYCASIYGIPTAVGTYTLRIQVAPFLSPKIPLVACNTPADGSGGSALVSPTTLAYYIIKIDPALPPSGVQEIGKDKFGLLQNTPNPFNGKTEIKYYVEGEDEAVLTVYNSLGSIVNKQIVKTRIGENSFTLSSNGLSAGVYIYSVKYKDAVSTKRLVINE